MRHTLVFNVSDADLTQAGEVMVEIFTNNVEALDVTEVALAVRTGALWGSPILGEQTS